MWGVSALTLLSTSILYEIFENQHHVLSFVPPAAVTPRRRISSSSSIISSSIAFHEATAVVAVRAGVVRRRVAMTSSTAIDNSSAYQPDRDVESQAYESKDGRWNLKYHDIKTRRDAADARAKVRAHLRVRVYKAAAAAAAETLRGGL